MKFAYNHYKICQGTNTNNLLCTINRMPNRQKCQHWNWLADIYLSACSFSLLLYYVFMFFMSLSYFSLRNHNLCSIACTADFS